MIVVDTSVWSRAWRRAPAETGPAARLIAGLVLENTPLGTPGIVLQELLSGVRTEGDLQRLEALLSPFPTLLARREHHVLAARLFNTCRSKGIATTATDLLIAATAILGNSELLTYDLDFSGIATCTPLRVWNPETR